MLRVPLGVVRGCRTILGTYQRDPNLVELPIYALVLKYLYRDYFKGKDEAVQFKYVRALLSQSRVSCKLLMQGGHSCKPSIQ